MLFLSLATRFLAAINSYAKPTARAVGSLDVSLSTPTDKIESTSDLKVVATVKNTGNEDLRILKYRTVLDDERPTRSFVVRKDGKEVYFAGAEFPSPKDRLVESDWVVIRAGEYLTAEHDAFALYDFSASGPGTFIFDPFSTFQVTGPDNFTRIEVANVHSVSITVTDVSKRELKFEKRQQVDCADSAHAMLIVQSVLEARIMASEAAAYIRGNRGEDQLYKDYFGSNSPDTVISNFMMVVNSNTTPGILKCSDPENSCVPSNSPAYNAFTGLDIYYCDSFYSQLPLSALCKGETTVDARNTLGGITLRHLITALVPRAVGSGYSCSASRGIDNALKVETNDNYECFATQVMINTGKCQAGGQ